MMAAVPCIGVFSQVNIDWSRYFVSLALLSIEDTHVDTGELGTVAIECVVVEVWRLASCLRKVIVTSRRGYQQACDIPVNCFAIALKSAILPDD